MLSEKNTATRCGLFLAAMLLAGLASCVSQAAGPREPGGVAAPSMKGTWKRMPDAPPEAGVPPGIRNRDVSSSWSNGSMYVKRGTHVVAYNAAAHTWTLGERASYGTVLPKSDEPGQLDLFTAAGAIVGQPTGGSNVLVPGGMLRTTSFAPRPYFSLDKFAGATLDIGGSTVTLPHDGAPVPRHTNSYRVARRGNQLAIWGGKDEQGWRPDGAWYDIAAGTWHPITAVGAPAERTHYDIVTIASDRFIVWSGEDNSGAMYDFAAGTWTTIASAGAPKAATNMIHNATLLTDGKRVAILPATMDGARFSEGGIFDPSTNSWKPMPTNDNFARAYLMRGWLLGDGQVLLANSSGKTWAGLLDMKRGTLRALPAPPIRANEGVAIHFTGTHLLLWGGVISKMTSPGGGCEGHTGDEGCDPVGPSYAVTPLFEGWSYPLR